MGVGNDLYKRSVGYYGGKFISDTNLHTPNSGEEFYALQLISDSVFETLTGNLDGNITTENLPSGLTIYGSFTEIKLTSGKIIAYISLVD